MVIHAKHGSARDLVDMEAGLISREIFVSKGLYETEQERVFARAWLFIGFEDQVRKPGDYFVSRMGEESVLLTRDRQSQIHVFLNSCRHRGMKVCRYDEGNTPVFTCPYHGWSYATDGKLVGVPHYKQAYHEELDKSQWGLIEVAQIANFKGTIWATWDPEAPSLDEYIGDMKPYMEQFFDRPDGTQGELEVLGLMKWTIPCNWKFGAENFIGDNYHGAPTHRSVDVVTISPSGQKGRHIMDNARLPSLPLNVSHHGHGFRAGVRLADFPYAPTFPNNPTVEEYYRQAYERRQQLQGERSRWRVSGGTIFPNGTHGTGQSIAVWHPNGPDQTEVWRWYFVHQDAPQELKDVLRHYYMRYGGPSGLTEQDDMENWNYAHKASRGTVVRRYPYNYTMGMGHEKRVSAIADIVKDGLVSEVFYTEQNQRGMYSMWATLMDAESWEQVRSSPDWQSKQGGSADDN